MKPRQLLIIALSCFISLNACNNGNKQPASQENDTTATESDTPVNPVTDSVKAIEPDTLNPADNLSEQTNSQQPATLKIGHINSAEVLLLMPDVKEADRKLQQFAQQLDNEIKARIAEYQEKYARLMNDTAAPQSVQETRMNELASLENTIAQLQQDGQNQIMQEKDKLYQPIYEKINRAIEAVARQEGYTYIIDASSGALVYGVDTYDITPAVKRKLGLR